MAPAAKVSRLFFLKGVFDHRFWELFLRGFIPWGSGRMGRRNRREWPTR